MPSADGCLMQADSPDDSGTVPQRILLIFYFINPISSHGSPAYQHHTHECTACVLQACHSFSVSDKRHDFLTVEDAQLRDLSELALGWATYNGDHMSMYAVNTSIPKTLVRHLVRYYADTCGDDRLSEILLDILDTPVSPELLPPKDGKIAQKTEDLVGPYELHDFFLYYMLRAGYEPDKIFRIAVQTFDGVYDREVILKWLKNFYRRFFMQQFKRSCLPDGPKVGTVAVSPRGDLRMSSDSCVRIWMDQVEKLS